MARLKYPLATSGDFYLAIDMSTPGQRRPRLHDLRH
jgi:hypothetical protein